MIRVLVSGFTQNYGGVERFIINYYLHLDPALIQIDFLTEAEHPAFEETILSRGGKVYFLAARSKDRLHYHRNLETFFQEHAGEYDIFWCNKCMLNNIDLLKMAKKYQIPKRIIHSHNSSSMDQGIKGGLMRILHARNKGKIEKYATDFWACSDFAAKWLFPEKLIRTKGYRFIPNAVDVREFGYRPEIRAEYRKKLGVGDEFLIGNVGRFNFQKNHEFLIGIMREIHDRDQSAKLLLIGVGELMQQIRETVKRYGLEESVVFLGKSTEVAQYMQAMDCFVLPSRFEGLPVVGVEAQAAGLPVFMARDGITPQAQLTERCRFLSLSDSPSVWAEEILSVKNLERRDETDAIARSGFEIAVATENLQKRLVALSGKE